MKKLREDTTCLNCGSTVEGRYCSDCGQMNTESRQTVFSLIGDFFAAFINYDNKSWRTLLALFTRPGKLSQEYMEGKRSRFLPPVTLYVFFNFVAFF